MSVVDRVTELVLPVLEPLGLHLYDVELNGATLRVTVDADGGVNLDKLAEATRAIGHEFDEVDPMPGKYTLEVSSPGLERRLRHAEHFAGAIGEKVNVKLGPQVEGDRRVQGELTEATDQHITVVDENGTSHELALADITKAVTVFDWGPAPKPGQPGSKKNSETSTAPAQQPASEPTEAERRAEAR